MLKTIKVTYAGYLSQFTGVSGEAFEVDKPNLEAVLNSITCKYPSLSPKVLHFAVDKKLIPSAEYASTILSSGTSIQVYLAVSGG
ncbi:MAG TPA: MoaD/ThiS family protein [Candidatus Deferrimicrobium sp.]|nr:MoaD/ThiS family protein [Candidatus Deferrimicrobium sp.]